MDFKRAIDGAIASGVTGFKQFLQHKISKNSDFLQQFFWVDSDTQMTVLNYLIHHYHETNKSTLLPMIDVVVALSQDNNCGEPLHQAASSGKTKLLLHLLRQDSLASVGTAALPQAHAASKTYFDVDKRDKSGRTLLSLILTTKDPRLLQALLTRNPNVHAISYMTGKIPFQSIHQAVALDFAPAITLLVQHGAHLNNPFGELKETPLLLAARLGKINALSALLAESALHHVLERENNHLLPGNKEGHRAIEELCLHLDKGTNRAETIRGIAILLCHGAQTPRSEAMCELLSDYRMQILAQARSYMKDKPELVNAFVNRCHLKDSALNSIMYARNSWANSIRHLFGIPSRAAVEIEELITVKDSSDLASLVDASAADLSQETNKLKLYAEFVRRYTQAYQGQVFTNRWSSMRWMIADGQCDWSTVLAYSQNHPGSRTRIIINEMLNLLPKLRERLEQANALEPQQSLTA